MKHIQTFEGFLNEYQKYSDFKGSWGSPEDLLDDVKLSVKHLLPVKWDEAEKMIKSVEDQSDDNKGIKFEITLSNGDKIHGFKTGAYRSDWEWYLNKKKMSKADITTTLEDKMYKPYEKWQRHYDMRDSTYMYSDDPRAYKSGSNHEKFINDLYNKLSSADKKRADEYKEKNK